MGVASYDYLSSAFYQLEKYAMVFSLPFKLKFDEYVRLCMSNCSICGIRPGLVRDKPYHQVVNPVGAQEMSKDTLQTFCIRCFKERLACWKFPEKLHVEQATWDAWQRAKNRKSKEESKKEGK